MTHGMSKTRTHKAWRLMLSRCDNSNDTHHWKYYGGKGVSVCERWRTFENFFADMGEKPVGKTLDRIDGNVGYEPGNCRWATHRTQVNNRSNTTHLEIDGVSKPITEWTEKYNKNYRTVRSRLKYGYVPKAALLAPYRMPLHEANAMFGGSNE